MKNKQWYAQMDGLRCIAVMLVLIEHYILSIGNVLGAREQAGRMGVMLFFVISGFLITEGLLYSLHLPKWQALKTFYIKRALRIFPIYYLLLLIACIIHPAFRDIAIYAFTYTFNFLPDVMTINRSLKAYGHLWSLSVEEQFYLVWPLVILFIRKPAFILVTICIAFFFFGAYSGLCAGVLLALTKWYFPKQYSAFKLLYVSILLTAATSAYYLLGYYSGLYVAISVVLVYLATCNAYTGFAKAILEQRFIAYVGKISYGIYLYHMPLYILLNGLFFNELWHQWYAYDFSFFPPLRYNIWVPIFLLYTTISIVVAHISYTFIERPFLKLKKRFDFATGQEMVAIHA